VPSLKVPLMLGVRQPEISPNFLSSPSLLCDHAR
jgi:hypothetical protein